VLAADLLASPTLPDDVAHFAALLVWWFLALVLVLYGHMGRLVQWDGPHWQLWQGSPATAGAILRGKMTAIGVMLLWPVTLVGAAGVVVLEARPLVVAAYAAAALGGTGVALGVLAVVGTLPMLVRPDDRGGATPGGRNLFGALLLVLGLQLAMAPAALAWRVVELRANQRGLGAAEAWEAAPAVLAAVLGYGLLALALGAAIGRWNFARLLRPR
jgi:hypothetical protein